MVVKYSFWFFTGAALALGVSAAFRPRVDEGANIGCGVSWVGHFDRGIYELRAIRATGNNMPTVDQGLVAEVNCTIGSIQIVAVKLK